MITKFSVAPVEIVDDVPAWAKVSAPVLEGQPVETDDSEVKLEQETPATKE